MEANVIVKECSAIGMTFKESENVVVEEVDTMINDE